MLRSRIVATGHLSEGLLCALLVVALLGNAAPSIVRSDDGVEVETELVAEVRQAVQGPPGSRESFRFVPATTLAQGDVVYYTVRIRNPTPVPARDVRVVQRIPANTTYVPRSATGPGAEVAFSVDGGQTFGPEEQLRVSDPQTGATRRAQAGDYTHIRWMLRNPLAPNAVALARFRAVFR